MHNPKMLLAVAALAVTCGSAAVELSDDARGQVILLPLVSVDDFERSELVVRNTSDDQGKAVRVVARDPVEGRPTASLNLYLGPGDAWRVRVDGVDAGDGERRARFAPWTDASCTHPALADLPDGMVFSDAAFDGDGNPRRDGDRLDRASVEIYEMGTLDAELAGDCAAIAERWAPGGVWQDDPHADVQVPTGTLEASVSIVGRFPARAFQYQGVALDDFRDAPLHTDAGALSPHLGDVRPAVSSVYQPVELANRKVLVEVKGRWDSYPVNAVNAVLMARTASGEFLSNGAAREPREGNGFAGVLLAFPTRPFHLDESGFYLPPGAVPAAGPFAGSDELDASVVNLDGERFAVGPPPGRQNCDRLRAALVGIAVEDSPSFGGRCDRQLAQLFVAGPPNAGRLEFSFDGEIVSDDNQTYRGQPVLGLLFQALTDPGVGDARFATTGWASHLQADR